LVKTESHPLLAGHATRHTQHAIKTLVIVAASDRGLCGGFNNQIQKKALEFLKQRMGEDIRIVTIGRRAEQVARRANAALAASFETISNAPTFERIRPMAEFIYQEFETERADRVFIAYTDYKSALTQIPTVAQLLPIVPEGELAAPPQESDDAMIFEPSPDVVLGRLLPRMLEMQIYQALLESAASEHSARMMAMRSAGDAASDMLDDLTFTLNQARQANITREISEISAGKAAIE
jgi:F-type H+-transporting ATPase subunit gamma